MTVPRDDPSGLAERLLGALGLAPELQARLGGSIQGSVTTLMDQARAADPSLAVDLGGFMDWVALNLIRLNPGLEWSSAPDITDALDRLRAEDLYVAYGCSLGHAGALEIFERRFAAEIDKVCCRFARQGISADDLKQIVRVKLFVPQESRPAKIAEYSGKGFLQNWVRVTTTRTAIDETRSQQSRRETLSERLLAFPGEGDLELDFLKEKYRLEFRQAFEAAVDRLTSRERSQLRFHVLGGMTLQQLATVYQVDRSTVVRHLKRIRTKLLAETRLELMRRLGLDREEFESLMRFIQSQLDVSLERVLAADPPEPENG